MKVINKNGVMNQVISIFILVLIVSVIAGMTFLFVASLKTEAITSSPYSTYTIINETGSINATGYQLTKGNDIGFKGLTFLQVINVSAGTPLSINSANWTVSNTGFIRNTTTNVLGYNKVNFTYSYDAVNNLNAYNAVNGTETAGANIITYLPLLFLALIFGTILVVTLRVIMPFINLGSQMGGSM